MTGPYAPRPRSTARPDELWGAATVSASVLVPVCVRVCVRVVVGSELHARVGGRHLAAIAPVVEDFIGPIELEDTSGVGVREWAVTWAVTMPLPVF